MGHFNVSVEVPHLSKKGMKEYNTGCTQSICGFILVWYSFKPVQSDVTLTTVMEDCPLIQMLMDVYHASAILLEEEVT